jgi:hypothetical protein
MKLEIEVSEFVMKHLAPDLKAAVEAAAEREATRRFHIERCKPRLKSPPRPVGRPRTDPAILEARKLGQRLLEVYRRRQQALKEAFEPRHGEELQQLKAMIEACDLQGLQNFAEKQPWTQKKPDRRQVSAV